MLTSCYLDGVRPFFIENTCVHVNCRGGGCATEEEDDDNDEEEDDEESGLQEKKIALDD